MRPGVTVLPVASMRSVSSPLKRCMMSSVGPTPTILSPSKATAPLWIMPASAWEAPERGPVEGPQVTSSAAEWMIKVSWLLSMLLLKQHNRRQSAAVVVCGGELSPGRPQRNRGQPGGPGCRLGRLGGCIDECLEEAACPFVLAPQFFGVALHGHQKTAVRA